MSAATQLVRRLGQGCVHWVGQQWSKQGPVSTLLVAGALGICVYVIVYPFVVVEYPPITDLPFHAAAMSILRHHGDPSWHFQEQFSLHLLESPYWTMWGLGAVFMLVFSPAWSAKLASIFLLALLPIGLAVLLRGMKKSPLLGLFGLAFVWNSLTHWGFINFVGAIGLYCMTVGVTLMLLDRPSRWRQIALTLSLLAVFGTHIFRFPFAVAAVLGTTLVMWPATRRWTPIVWPMVPSLSLFFGWIAVRESAGKEEVSFTGFHMDRLKEIPRTLFGSFNGPKELALAEWTLWLFVAVAVGCLVVLLLERRWKTWTRRDAWWAVGTTLVPLCLAGGSFVLFLTLPMSIGTWWYVYPREMLTAAFLALALIPNVPKIPLLRLGYLALIAWGVGGQSFFVAESWYAFNEATEDFQQIKRRIPQAPRLGYMIFDHGGSNRTTTPFIHLPAWVQAERGGWLSFHFMGWGHGPIRYRNDPENVPPPTPLRFEWTPQRFNIRTRGKFFNWFLVRSRRDPTSRFRVDPSIRFVEQQGTWWLYHREVEK